MGIGKPITPADEKAADEEIKATKKSKNVCSQ